jgi:hypothetical protein
MMENNSGSTGVQGLVGTFYENLTDAKVQENER